MSQTKRPTNRRQRNKARRRQLRSQLHAHLAVYGWVPIRVLQPAAATGYAYGMRTDSDAIIVTVNAGIQHYSTSAISDGWVECDWNDLHWAAFWRLKDYAAARGLAV